MWMLSGVNKPYPNKHHVIDHLSIELLADGCRFVDKQNRTPQPEKALLTARILVISYKRIYNDSARRHYLHIWLKVENSPAKWNYHLLLRQTILVFWIFLCEEVIFHSKRRNFGLGKKWNFFVLFQVRVADHNERIKVTTDNQKYLWKINKGNPMYFLFSLSLLFRRAHVSDQLRFEVWISR